MVIVLAILAGVLVVGCCGGVVVFGLGGALFWVRSDVRAVQDEAMMQPMVAPPEMQEALDKMERDLQPLKIEPENLDAPVRTKPPSLETDVKGLETTPSVEEKSAVEELTGRKE
jgi:hypothetical protein